MSGINRPLLRMAYKHISGEVFVVWGICKDFTAKVGESDNEIVILASLKDGTPLWFPLAKFWDKSPKTGEPRFELVTPT